jgi:hypothetical protein
MEPDLMRVVLDNSISLAVLLAVLFGIYKLTSKFLGLFLCQVDEIVTELRRIANAQSKEKEE